MKLNELGVMARAVNLAAERQGMERGETDVETLRALLERLERASAALRLIRHMDHDAPCKGHPCWCMAAARARRYAKEGMR